MFLDKVLAHYQPKIDVQTNTLELHLSGRFLPASAMIRIGLALRGKFVENSTKLIALKLPVIGSSTVQCYGF